MPYTSALSLAYAHYTSDFRDDSRTGELKPDSQLGFDVSSFFFLTLLQFNPLSGERELASGVLR